MFTNQKVLVTGGTGMIGRELVQLLLERGAKVYTVSLDDPIDMPSEITHIKADLREYSVCKDILSTRWGNIDYVFHLAGIKGSPLTSIKYPARFMVPMLQLNTNLMEAAYQSNVKRLLYTSSMGVYAPSDKFLEESVWDKANPYPSDNDRFAGWSKRMGELQIEAYACEGWYKASIVRPANVYGRYDNFDLQTCMVIPALINKMLAATDIIEVWGDGSNIRDFIHAKDVAKAMIFVVQHGILGPINLASGIGYSIKTIVNILKDIINPNLQIKWLGGPGGDKSRVLDVTQLTNSGFKPTIPLEIGLVDTVEWYKANRNFNRYNAFKEK